MSLNLGVMSAAVTLDDRDYRSKLSGLEGASESTFRKIAAYAAGYLSGRALFNLAQSGVQAFADLQTASWNFSQVFSQIPGKANAAEAEMRKLYKLSETTSKNMLSRAADQLQAFGFSAEKSLELARKASERGIDLASFKGGNQADAVDAIVSALTGQTERMKRFGVVVNQGGEKFKELVKSIQEATGATELQAKAQATLQMIIEQTKNAEGDYLKEGSTIAQQQMDIAEATIKAKSAIGEFLAEGVSPLMDHWNKLLVSFADSDPALQRLEIRAVAAGAAFAALAKFGALAKANAVFNSVGDGLKSLVGGFSGTQAKAEADAVVAAEELKRAAIAKTEAFEAARAEVQTLRLAKESADKAAAAVAEAKLELDKAVKANASADAIAAAEAKVTMARQASHRANVALSQANTALTAKRNVAKTATLACAAAEHADTAAKAMNAKMSTLAGRAQVAFANGLNAAKTAANGLVAALGPVGIAMITLSAAYMAYQYLTEKISREIEGQITLAQERADAARAEAEEKEKARSADAAQLARLEELSKYERLNNSEKKEAETLIKHLAEVYGNLDISIDDITGKIKIGAKAWDQLNEAQKRALTKDLTEQLNANTALIHAQQTALREKLGSWFRNNFYKGIVEWAKKIAYVLQKIGFANGVNIEANAEKVGSSDEQNEFDEIMKLKTAEEQLSAFEKMRNRMIAAGKEEEAAKIKDVIDALKQQIKLQKQLDDAAKSDNKIDNEPTPDEQKKQSEAERNAQNQLETKEWEIKFNSASVDQQVAMLNEKIAKVFSDQSGKYRTLEDFKNADRGAMTEQELKDLQEIIELEEKRNQIRTRSADVFRQESESYKKFLEQREKRRQGNAVEREIKDAEKRGDQSGVSAIMQREYERAKESAKLLQREYEQAVRDAEADKILTNDEKKRVEELRQKMQDAMSDEDRWGERISSAGDKQQQSRAQSAVGSFSAAILNGLLGDNSPEKETAKNTKELVRLTREKNGSSGAALSYI